MKLTIIKDYTYWHGGCRRADYVAGQEVDADDQEMIAVALSEGWVTDEALSEGWVTDEAPKEKASKPPSTKASKPPSTKAHKAAPENK